MGSVEKKWKQWKHPFADGEAAIQPKAKSGSSAVPIPSIEARGEASLAPSRSARSSLSVPMPTISGSGEVVKET